MTLTSAQEAWLTDLETTTANQARGMLHAPDIEGFCCLGRACIVAEQHGIPVNRDACGRIEGVILQSQPAVHKWLGLLTERGSPEGDLDNPNLFTLTLLNDKGTTFRGIAALLRSNPEAFFNPHPSESI